MSTFGVVIGECTPQGREEYLRHHSAAIVIPSPTTARIESISNVFLVVGVIKRDGGTLYCTAIFVDPQLGYLKKHRELLPTSLERVIWGSTLPVVEKSFQKGTCSWVKTKLSAALCWSVSLSQNAQ